MFEMVPRQAKCYKWQGQCKNGYFSYLKSFQWKVLERKVMLKKWSLRHQYITMCACWLILGGFQEVLKPPRWCPKGLKVRHFWDFFLAWKIPWSSSGSGVLGVMLLQLSSLGYILSMCCLEALFNAIWSWRSSRSTFKAVQSSHFMVHEYRLASYANKDDYTITGLCYALLDITELLLHKKEVDICAQVSNL